MGEGKVKAALDALREWAGKGAKVREDERRAFKYYLRLWEGLTVAERRRMSVQFRAGGGR